MITIKKLVEYSIQFENGIAVRNYGTLLINDEVMDYEVRIREDAFGKMFFNLYDVRYNIVNTGDLYNPVFELEKNDSLEDFLNGFQRAEFKKIA